MNIIKKLNYNSSYTKYRNSTNDHLYCELEKVLKQFSNVCSDSTSSCYINVINKIESRVCEFEQMCYKYRNVLNSVNSKEDEERSILLFFIIFKDLNDYLIDIKEDLILEGAKSELEYKEVFNNLSSVFADFRRIPNGDKIVNSTLKAVSDYVNYCGKLSDEIIYDSKEYLMNMCDTRDALIEEYVNKNSSLVRLVDGELKFNRKYLDFLCDKTSDDEDGDIEDFLFDENDNNYEKASKQSIGMLSWKELNKLARKVGFEKSRQKGDHGVFKSENGSEVVIIPQGREIGKGLQKKIIKDLSTSL